MNSVGNAGHSWPLGTTVVDGGINFSVFSREGKGIWGTWEILWDARGGFHIWPRSFAAANEEAVSAEEEMPAPAFKV